MIFHLRYPYGRIGEVKPGEKFRKNRARAKERHKRSVLFLVGYAILMKMIMGALASRQLERQKYRKVVRRNWLGMETVEWHER